MLAATSSPTSNTTNGMPRSWRWAAAARPTGPAPITATGRCGGVHRCVSLSSGDWVLVETNGARRWDAFRGMLRPSPPASVCMAMGMTMTLDRNTDQRLDLDTIWAEVGASMERFVRRRISDPHQADDVVAEVMLRIHQNLGDARRPGAGHGLGVPHRPQRDHRSLPPHRSPPRGARRRNRTGRRPERRRLARRPRGHPVRARRPASDHSSMPCPPTIGVRSNSPTSRVTPKPTRRGSKASRVSGMKSRVQRGRRQFATLVKQCCDVTTDSRGELVDFQLRADGCGCPPPVLNSSTDHRSLLFTLPFIDYRRS